jgi:hypothetical protein
MSLIVPNLATALVDKLGLLSNQAWISWFQQFSQAPSAAIILVVGPSPFAYQTRQPGLINVHGGTVSAITITRGTVVIDVNGQKLIPISIKDTITVTYSVKPTMLFLPSY